MGYLGNQITTVFPTSISVDSATINGNTDINGDTAKLTLTDTSSHSANTGPEVSFFSKDSGETSREVAKIVGESHSGSNEGNLAFQTRNGGTLETKWKVFKNGNMLPSNSAYGIYLGTTSVADGNLLDDYEEGTWTPTLVSSGSTFQYSIQQGIYTKVGDLVTFNCVIQLDGGGNSFSSNSVALNGWPFATRNSQGAGARFFIYGRYLNLNFGNGYTYAYATIDGNSQSATLRESGDNVATDSIAANDLSSSSGQLYINGHYYT